MMRNVVIALGALFLIAGSAPAASFDFSAIEYFEKSVRPLLVEQCYKCHSDNAKAIKGHLRLDSRAAILKGGDNGPAGVPGNAEKSLIVEAIRYRNPDVQMPPAGRLKDEQIAVIEKWVALGMPWPDEAPTSAIASSPATQPAELVQFTDAQKKFWCFQPVKVVAPDVSASDSGWAKTELDRYVLASLQKKNLKPAAMADKRVLLRRATFDLTGLPPTPAEIDAFLADASPDAFAKVVDRLLASPAYGERWGRHWLDVVRFADSRDVRDIGAAYDISESYRYRDYVIKAFNNDLPYDQFVRDQIAGDLLPSKEPGKVNADGIVASGMLSIGSWGGGDADAKKMYTDIVDDQVNVVSRAFMGLTVACARCHDHKFDPIPTADYYGLAGIFFSTMIATPQTSPPPVLVPLATPEQIAAVETSKAQLAEKDKRLAAFRDEQFAALPKASASHTAEYLLAAYDYEHRAAEQAGLSPAAFATAHQLRGDALAQWVEYLSPRSIDFRLMNVGTLNADGRKGVIGWHGDADLPAVLINTTDEVLAVPGTLPPKSVAVHPGPTSGVGVAWRSPLAGTIQITGTVAHAHPACGDGIAWMVQRGSGDFSSLAAGDLQIGGKANFADAAYAAGLANVKVAAGDIIRLTILPKANHSCDLTDVELHIAEQGGQSRVWDLAKDLLIDPTRTAKSNPLPDSLGNAEVWQFLDLQANATQRHADRNPDATLAAWFDVAKRPNAVRAELESAARAVQQAVDTLATRPADTTTPAGRFFADVISDQSPFRAANRTDESVLSAELRAKMAAMRTELETLKKNAPPPIEVAIAAKDGGVPGTKYAGFNDCQIHIRGSYERLGAMVPRHFPRIIAGDDQAKIVNGSGRRELAEWLTRPTHPLTARVMVNRIWQHHFGKGLVRTPGNFGKLGEAPTHPELLDYLADQFVKSGWSMKAMHRLMMLSATYQESAIADPETAAADPDNRLFGRMAVRRLEAESIRDTLLAVAGRLDRTMGGKPIRDLTVPRRTVYLMTIRSDKSGFWFLFDKADPDGVVDERTASTVAPQSLFLLNGDFLATQVGGLVDRLTANKAETDTQRINLAYPSLFGRPAAPEEVEAGVQFLAQARTNSPASSNADRQAWEQYAQVLLCTNELIYVE